MGAVLECGLVVPVINRPVVLDFFVGLVPVVGDVATAAMGAWLVWEARNLGMSKFQLTRMAANVGVDTLLGAVPRSEEHTSELQSLMRISYAVFCLKKKKMHHININLRVTNRTRFTTYHTS